MICFSAVLRTTTLAWAGLAACIGCSSSGAELRVDLRSDWVGGVEVSEVITRLDGLEEARTSFVTGDDLAAGVRVGLFESVPSGTQRVSVELIAPDGEIVGARNAVVSVRGSTGLTLLVTRNCAGVTCDDPAANQCLDGRCVPPTCTVENLAACGPPSCSGPVDCVASAPCVEPRCVAGACLQSGGVCGAGEYCDPESGCRPVPVDAGMDAGSDASIDAPFDAPLDVGLDAPIDAGVDVGADAAVACGEHEPDDNAADGLDLGVEGMIDGRDVFTTAPLALCAGDEDWIAVQTLGLVRVTVSLQGISASSSVVCLELYNYTQLSHTIGDPPTLELGPSCAAVAGGDFVTLGPVDGTLVGGGNYVMARVTFSDAFDEPVYTVRFDGEPSI